MVAAEALLSSLGKPEASHSMSSNTHHFPFNSYLMKALGLSFIKAHNYVMERRPIITPHMMEVLVEYDVYLKSQRAKAKAAMEDETPQPPQDEEEEHLMEANFEI